MYLAKIVGTVVSTSKNEDLIGSKLLLIKKLNENLELLNGVEIAVDSVGAGVGETVMVVKGTSARNVFNKNSAPIDLAVVGIVDSIEVNR